MRFRSFLFDKIVNITLICFALLVQITILIGIGAGTYAIFFFSILTFGCSISGFLYEYWKKRSYYFDLLKSLDGLDRKSLIPELIDEPDFIEGKILYETLQVCNKSMNDEIAYYQQNSKEYREYIETWIHEIKTPIASAKLIIENNLDHVTRSIDEEIELIDGFIEQALYYSRSSGVEKDYIIKPVTLQELVSQVLRKNSKEFIAKKIRLEKGDLDQTVYTDVKWLTFILNQVIGNAMKYKSDNPVISIQAVTRENKIILEITDNGIGISASDLPKVCEKGYTGTTGRKYAKSTGMGLYLCKKLCLKMGLNLDIESVEGAGTTVRILFPVSRFHEENLT